MVSLVPGLPATSKACSLTRMRVVSWLWPTMSRGARVPSTCTAFDHWHGAPAGSGIFTVPPFCASAASTAACTAACSQLSAW